MSGFLNKVKYFMGIEDLDEYEDDYEDENYEYLDKGELEMPVETKASRKNNKVVNIHTNANMKLVVHEPINFEDAPKIVDDIKMRNTVVVNLEHVEGVMKKQVFDFINGGIYSLGGKIHKVSKDIFILAPDNVEIVGKMKDDIDNTNAFNW